MRYSADATGRLGYLLRLPDLPGARALSVSGRAEPGVKRRRRVIYMADWIGLGRWGVMLGVVGAAIIGAPPASAQLFGTVTKVPAACDPVANGAIGDGQTDNTKALQTTLDTCKGAWIRLPPGTYLTGPLFLRSGVTLDFAAGTTVIGTDRSRGVQGRQGRHAGRSSTARASRTSRYVAPVGSTARGPRGGRRSRLPRRSARAIRSVPTTRRGGRG